MTQANKYAITALDSRYFEKTKQISEIFSDFNSVKNKVKIEIEYYKFVCELLNKEYEPLDFLIKDFRDIDYNAIKDREKVTKHDIKAIEYYIKSFIFNNTKEMVHFGLTSQDVNSLSTSMSMINYYQNIFLKNHEKIHNLFRNSDNFDVLFCSRTHGQAAIPTTFQKEFSLFQTKINSAAEDNYYLTCKFGGTNGDFSALRFASENIRWNLEFNNFVSKMSDSIVRSEESTQVDDNLALSKMFSMFVLYNNLLIEFCQNIWMYQSLGLMKQKNSFGQIGSSVMPQKINPIDFENAEGNLQLANCELNFMKDKLVVSRMQRDLSDSTIIREIGVPLARMQVAVESIINGFEKLEPNREACKKDLEQNWQSVTEGIQTLLRLENVRFPYEIVKDALVDAKSYKEFLDNLFFDNKLANISDKAKDKILNLTPEKYFYGNTNM